MEKAVKTVKTTNRFKEGFDFLSYGLDAFAVIGFELLLAYVIEPFLFNRPMKEYEGWMTILHWIVTCIGWGLGAYLIMRDCSKKTNFDIIGKFRNTGLFKNCEKISLIQWILIVAGVVICLISTWIDWNGSKVLKEFARRGAFFSHSSMYIIFLKFCSFCL